MLCYERLLFLFISLFPLARASTARKTITKTISPYRVLRAFVLSLKASLKTVFCANFQRPFCPLVFGLWLWKQSKLYFIYQRTIRNMKFLKKNCIRYISWDLKKFIYFSQIKSYPRTVHKYQPNLVIRIKWSLDWALFLKSCFHL